MATLAELAEKECLTPSELKRFGNRVRVFEFRMRPKEEFAVAKRRHFDEIEAFVASTGGQLYTGIHSENDWSKERWWEKGGHLVNRTLNFAVIAKTK